MEKLPLKALRAKVNMTQGEVADKLGVNRATYGKWEKYDSFPDAVQLIRLSAIFECSLDTFYFLVETNSKLAI